MSVPSRVKYCSSGYLLFRVMLTHWGTGTLPPFLFLRSLDRSQVVATVSSSEEIRGIR